VAQRWPWENKVDIDYEIVCDDTNADIHVFFNGVDNDRNRSVKMLSLEGDGADGPVKAGRHHVIWDAGADAPDYSSSSFATRIEAVRGDALYLVIDLSNGPTATNYPVSYLPHLPDTIPDLYRTTNLVLRYIPPGTFLMGSPDEEFGRYDDHEDLHTVMLTKPFYIGVFEVTQMQWELVMGDNPSYGRGDMRPVEEVTYGDIRGTDDGMGWPTHGRVDPDSFLGWLRIRCNLHCDLPTDAQWEYACRAGTTTALNSGKNLTDTGTCPNMSEVGRYSGNQGDGRGGYSQHTKVGSYLANRWNLHDMHGNVCEWTLDYYQQHLGLDPATDPVGGSTGSHRVLRGGWWLRQARDCRSAHRHKQTPSSIGTDNIGMRLAVFPAGQ